MKNPIHFLSLLFLTMSLSWNVYSAPNESEEIPETILIKTDQNGEVYVHRSNTALDKITGVQLDQLKFERLADVADKVDIKNVPASETPELDQDLPRQSWYVYWNFYGYYPYYPIHYSAYNHHYNYNYNYQYYPYHSYNWNGCNYYWYGQGPGFRY